jgi:hypothetical protein
MYREMRPGCMKYFSWRIRIEDTTWDIRCAWKGINLKKLWYEGVDWIHLACVRVD